MLVGSVPGRGNGTKHKGLRQDNNVIWCIYIHKGVISL